VGGTGKTPTVCALAEMLKGYNVHIVTRGYKSQIKTGVHRVDNQKDDAKKVGDEPLLLSWCAPCWVAPDRAAGVKAAEDAGAELIILDDGFQNHSVIKDVSFVVVDTDVHFGNGQIIPAGPLREPVETGLKRADAIIAIGRKPYTRPAPCPVIRASLQPKYTGLDLRGVRTVAFAGIGRPQKFFTTLREMGAVVIEEYAFPDHHTYDHKVLLRMINRARSQDAIIVTTEKDAVKLPKTLVGQISVVQVQLLFQEQEKLSDCLGDLLSRLDHSKHGQK
jgi:tetraacyldisaccharide 4'-kinase